MKNGILKLDFASILDSVLMAVISAVVVGLVQLVSTSGFSLFTADWVSVGKNMLDIGFIAGIVTLGQNLISTNSGDILGIKTDNIQ